MGGGPTPSLGNTHLMISSSYTTRASTTPSVYKYSRREREVREVYPSWIALLARLKIRAGTYIKLDVSDLEGSSVVMLLRSRYGT